MPSSDISVQRDPLKELWITAFKDLHVQLGHDEPTDPDVIEIIEKTAEVYADAMTNWFNEQLRITWEQDGSKNVTSVTIEDKT